VPRLVGTLKQSLTRIFAEQIEDQKKVASRISNAYQSYCQSASGPLGDPVILKGVEFKLFEQNLASLMAGQAPPPLAGNLIVQAITAFWLAPPVLTGGGGVCASIVPAAAMSKMVATKVDASNKAAATLADSLHLMTSTVFVTYPYPIPPGLLL
jgi:hypothetical protein